MKAVDESKHTKVFQFWNDLPDLFQFRKDFKGSSVQPIFRTQQQQESQRVSEILETLIQPIASVTQTV